MQAIQKVVGDPLGQELYDLWKEYEAQETVEAVYCKDIDKFEMVVQAYEYEKEHLQPPGKPDPNDDTECDNESNNNSNNSQPSSSKINSPNVRTEPLRTFFVTTNSVFKTPLFRRLDHELRERREAMLQTRGWTVTIHERQQYDNDDRK